MEKENIKVNVIITGCIHGCLKKMYDDILNYSQKNNIKIDLVLCTGDFESLIEKKDLNYLSCPEKYKHMGDFHLFYEGKYPIPYTTIFIGCQNMWVFVNIKECSGLITKILIFQKK